MPKSSNNTIIPDAIKRLHLCRALSDCGKLAVTKSFKQSTEECLYVYDDNKLGHTDWSNVAPSPYESKCFKARNTNHTVLVLLPLDHRIITGSAVIAGGVADCAMLTEKEMSFVEFKTNVYSQEFVEEHDQKAVTQLWHTYSCIIAPRCKGKGVIITDMVSVDFYVVFDQELDVTTASASRQSLMLDFLEQNQLPLYFDNEKDFR